MDSKLHTGIVLGGPMAGQKLMHTRPYFDLAQRPPLELPTLRGNIVGATERIGRYEFVAGIWWWRGWGK